MLLGCWPILGAAQDCGDWQATFASVEGRVQIQAPGSTVWMDVAQNDVVCRGYRVRVDAFSRAALRLPDDSLMRLDESASLTITEPRDGIGSLIDIVRGIIHVISRDPRSLRFNTPYANAGLEGTEFSIAVDDRQTNVTVVEGEVVLSNEMGQVSVFSGERATATVAAVPVVDEARDAFESADWTRYFPPILGGDLPAPDQAPTAAESRDPEFFTARAARRLGVGSWRAAEDDLDQALRLDAGNATAYALKAWIAIGRGDRAAARGFVDSAVALEPESSTVLLTRARLQQSNFDLEGAERSLERAVEVEPGHAIAWSSLAEVRLMRDDFDGAVAAAETAIRLNPDSAAAYTTLGFANLRRTRTDRAVESFEQATRLDQGAPLPRLGLGLALSRRGNVLEGRRQMELAVALDPQSSLTRSTMAKSYMAEYRAELTETQLEIARRLDPDDPTPHYYAALHDRDANMPIDALLSLRAANALNGNRAVYRSQMRLDEDIASRSAAIGELHRKLGFEQLALAEGWESSIRDPGDFSAHRLLGDVYAALPYHQIARVNELAQSQLLQPANVVPIQPQLSQASRFIMDAVGPSDLAFSEFGPVLTENGISVQASAVGGSFDTAGADVAVAGLHDHLSYSIGHYRYATDGFRANNDLDTQISNAFLQFRVNANTSVLGELRSSRAHSGDLKLLFNPDNFATGVRQSDDVDSARFGVNHRYGPRGSILASVIVERADVTAQIAPIYSGEADARRVSADIRDIHRTYWGHIDSGIGWIEQRGHGRQTVVFQETKTKSDSVFSSAYSYANIDVSDNLIVTLGASWDSLDTPLFASDGLKPKLGVVWQATADTTVRLSAVQTLQGPFVSRHSIQPRLEPTHVAGFNQFFLGAEGEESTRYGIALDQTITERLYGGVEASKRSFDTPLVQVTPGLPNQLTWGATDESLFRAYVYWMPGDRVSLSALYQVEHVDNDAANSEIEDFADSDTKRLPLAASIFGSNGLRAGIKATFVEQSGNFGVGVPGIYEPGSDRFWVLDLSVGYRLPKRHGELSLNMFNALDETFRFQDTEPENPSIMPDRMLSFRFTLAY